jgi:TetR/AcrR family transcriptional regulator
MAKKMIRTRDAEATKRRLLDVARRIFSRDGYEGARTDLVAKKAGVTKAMINYYYGGKKRLYRELILHDMQKLQRRLGERVSSGLPSDQKLARLIEVLAAGYRENPELVRILVREQMSGSRNLEPRVWKSLFKFYETVRNVLEEGKKSGAFRIVDAHATHLSLVGGLLFYLITEPARETYARAGDLPSTPDWSAYVSHTTKLFLRGLSNGPQKRSKAQ